MNEFRPPAVVNADAEVTRRFRTGDEATIRELVDRYGGYVYGVARRLTGPGDEADEVARHTFLQAWRNAEAFEAGDPFGPWLGSLTVRVATSHARPGSAGPAVSGSVVGDEAVDGNVVADEVLAESGRWPEPPADLADRCVAAILAEATVHPAELFTADDLRAARLAASSSRSLRTIALGAAGAGLVLILGILALGALGGTGGAQPTTIELRPTGRVPDVSGSIEVESVDAGLRIVLDAPSLPNPGAGQRYEALVVLADGSTVSAGTFVEGDGVTLAAGVGTGEGDQFVVVLAAHAPADARVAPEGVFAEHDVVLRATLP